MTFESARRARATETTSSDDDNDDDDDDEGASAAIAREHREAEANKAKAEMLERAAGGFNCEVVIAEDGGAAATTCHAVHGPAALSWRINVTSFSFSKSKCAPVLSRVAPTLTLPTNH